MLCIRKYTCRFVELRGGEFPDVRLNVFVVAVNKVIVQSGGTPFDARIDVVSDE